MAHLFHAVYHLAAVRGVHPSSSATYQHSPLYLCQRRLTADILQHLKKHIWAILTDITDEALEAKPLINYSLTSRVHDDLKHKLPLMEFA